MSRALYASLSLAVGGIVALWILLSLFGVPFWVYPPKEVNKGSYIYLRYDTDPTKYHVLRANCFNNCSSRCENYSCRTECLSRYEVGTIYVGDLVKKLFPDPLYLAIILAYFLPLLLFVAIAVELLKGMKTVEEVESTHA